MNKNNDTNCSGMTRWQKGAETRRFKKQAAWNAAEEKAKLELMALGYGLRFYAGKRHAIEGLEPNETYYQEQFPGGYDSWQEALAAVK